MIQQPLVVVVSFLLAVTAIACGKSGDSTNSVPASSSGATTVVRSNADLENAVTAKFKVDEQLRSADLGVSADAAKNEITLSGSVESEALRSKAVDLARSVDSGVIVNDQIDVKPSGRSAENSSPSERRAHG
jgi:osmotically-inducible protein OsmY